MSLRTECDWWPYLSREEAMELANCRGNTFDKDFGHLGVKRWGKLTYRKDELTALMDHYMGYDNQSKPSK